MLSHLSKDPKFAKIIKKHLIEVMSHLFENNIHFGILCRIEHVTFNPDLSDEIKEGFQSLTLFYLAGFTFESAHISEEYLIFEAGFGAQNQGAIVSVPLLDIIQIIIDETLIFVNSTAKSDILGSKPVDAEEKQSEARESSLNALMSNPENAKLFKKRKK